MIDKGESERGMKRREEKRGWNTGRVRVRVRLAVEMVRERGKEGRRMRIRMREEETRERRTKGRMQRKVT